MTGVWWLDIQGQFDDLSQDCSNHSALAMELLQNCTKSSNCTTYTILGATWRAAQYFYGAKKNSQTNHTRSAPSQIDYAIIQFRIYIYTNQIIYTLDAY